MRVSWAIKIEFAFLKKSNNPIATELCENLLNNCRKIEIFLVHNKIKLQNCVVHYLCENKMKIGIEN